MGAGLPAPRGFPLFRKMNDPVVGGAVSTELFGMRASSYAPPSSIILV